MTMVPATIWKLLDGATADDIRRHAAERRAAGLPWYSPALTIWQDKEGYAALFAKQRDAYVLVRAELAALICSATNAQSIIKSLPGRIPGLGPFRAYEVVTSLTYSEHLPQLREKDLFHIGPGAIDGLEMLTGGSRFYTHTNFEALRIAVVRELGKRRRFRWIPPKWQGDQSNAEPHKFTLRTLEDSLCEFRKYVAMNGDGSVAKRRTYRKMDVAV
jgi:hypothetical protein